MPGMSHFIYLVLALVLNIAAGALPAQATEAGCDCSRYGSWLPQLELTQQIALIGAASLRRQDSPLATNEALQRALRLRLEAEAFVPAECREFVLGRMSPQFQLWLADSYLAPAAQLSISGAVNPLSIIDSYKVTMAQTCQLSARATRPSFCTPAGNLNRLVSFFNLSQSEIEKFGVRDSNGKLAYQLSGETLDVIRVFLRGYQLQLQGGEEQGGQARMLFLQSQAGHLTSDQIIQFGRMAGTLDYRNYENERNNQLYKAKGVRTAPAISLNSAKTLNQEVSPSDLTGDPDAKPDPNAPAIDPANLPVPLGVCRDISSQQAFDMRALGMKRVYVLSWAHAGDEGHVTVVAAPNDNPTKIYKINEGELSVSQHADGAVALFEDNTDASTNYRLWEPAGGLVSDIPSEFGKVIEVAAGGNVTRLDPVSAGPARFMSAEAALPSDTQLRVFHAEDRTGAQYLGTSLGQRWNTSSEIAPGEAALVLGHQKLPAAVLAPPGASNPPEDRNMEFAAVRVSQSLNTPYLTLSELPLRGRVVTNTMAVATETYLPDRFSVPQGDLRINAGLQAQLGEAQPGETQKPQLTAYVGTQLVPGIKDVRNGYLMQLPRVVVNQLVASLELKTPLDSRTRTYVLVSALAVCSQLSCRGKAEFAAAYRNLAASLVVQGRFAQEAANFEEGTTRTISWNMAAQLLSTFPAFASITGTHSLDSRDNRIQSILEVRR